jgi:hypothetical protein
MKKVRIILSLFVVLAFSVFVTSCGKDDPDPVEEPNLDCEGSLAQEGKLADGKISEFPYTITPTFTPSGYYENANQDVDFAYTCEDQNVTFVYTRPATAQYFGASFLNENKWDRYFSISTAATRITFEAKFDYNADVVLNAFAAGDKYGKVTLERKTTPVATPVWEKFTIDLLDTPDDFDGDASTDPLNPETTGFISPLGIIIEDVAHLTQGETVTIQLRNIKFETTPAP